MHASAEPPPGVAGLAAAGSTAQLGAQHEQPDDPALAVAAQVSANDRIIAHWLDLCGRELERQYALAANGVDIWVWWPLDKAWYPGKVESFCEVTCQHTILYSDGDREELVLVLERFSLQLPPGRVASCDQSQLQPQRQQQRRRRRRRQSRPAAQESDEESDDSDDEEAWQQQQQQQQQDQQQQRQQRELRLQQRQQRLQHLQLQQWQQQQEQEPPQQQQQEQQHQEQEQQLQQEQKPLPQQEHEQQHQEQEMLQEQEQQLQQEQPPPQEHKQQHQEQETPQEQEQQLQQEQKLPPQQEHEQQHQEQEMPQEQEQQLQQEQKPPQQQEHEQQQHQGQEMPQEQEQQLQHEQQQPQQEPPLQQEQEQRQQQQQQLLQESSPSASGARSRRGKRKRSAPVEQGNASVPAHPLPQPSTPGQVPQAATYAAPQQQAEAEQQPGLLQRIRAIVQACDTPAAAASGVDGPLLSRFVLFWVKQADEEKMRRQVAALDACVQSGSFTSVGALLQYLLREL